MRQVFHKLRSVAIKNFNEQFKGIFDGHSQVPTKGLRNTRRFALGAILLYQLALLSSLSARPAATSWTQGVLEGGLMNYDQASLKHPVMCKFLSHPLSKPPRQGDVRPAVAGCAGRPVRHLRPASRPGHRS